MTLFLIRHASAGVRNVGDRHDDRRPLDGLGVDQARRIAELLGSEPIEAVFSSPARRCVDTVAVLADALGLPVETAPPLFEGTSSSRAIEFVRSHTGRTVVACSHGDIIPDVLRSLEVGGSRIEGRGCAKGSIWRLDNDSERIESATYLGVVDVVV